MTRRLHPGAGTPYPAFTVYRNVLWLALCTGHRIFQNRTSEEP